MMIESAVRSIWMDCSQNQKKFHSISILLVNQSEKTLTICSIDEWHDPYAP